MPQKKGCKKSGGRVKGTPNKSTRDIREAYRMLIENNLDNLTKWLEKVAVKDPAKAIYILSDLSEYVLPKLSRVETDLTTKGEKIQSTQISLTKEQIDKAIENL